MMKIHLFGASGSGCSSLGRRLADRLNCSFYDTDDFYWERTDPPFVVRSDVNARNSKLLEALQKDKRWVLAGSISTAWGMEIVNLISLSIFMIVPKHVRMARLMAREEGRYGHRLREGGDMHAASQSFLAWSDGYDTGLLPGRSRARHEAWFESLVCSKMVVENTGTFAQVLEDLIKKLDALEKPVQKS